MDRAGHESGAGHARALVRAAERGRQELAEGTGAILDWLSAFALTTTAMGEG